MKQNQKNQSKDENSSTDADLKENCGVLVYGHLKITDISTGEVLVHKRA